MRRHKDTGYIFSLIFPSFSPSLLSFTRLLEFLVLRCCPWVKLSYVPCFVLFLSMRLFKSTLSVFVYSIWSKVIIYLLELQSFFLSSFSLFSNLLFFSDGSEISHLLLFISHWLLLCPLGPYLLLHLLLLGLDFFFNCQPQVISRLDLMHHSLPRLSKAQKWPFSFLFVHFSTLPLLTHSLPFSIVFCCTTGYIAIDTTMKGRSRLA